MSTTTVSSLDTLNLDTFLDEHTDIDDSYVARGIHIDKIQDKIAEILSQLNTNTAGVEPGNTTNISTLKVAETTLTATEIVGTAAGDIGHAAGATLVEAPGAGYALELVSAILIYDYDTAAYTGGVGDDLVIQNGSTATALTTSVAKADLLGASGDKIVQVNALASSDQALVANKALSLKSTAWTQPGTAAGVLRCHVTYRVHTTGL